LSLLLASWVFRCSARSPWLCVSVWLSEPGRRTVAFAGEAYNETKRVSWPTRKETTQMTGIVFAFVAITGLLMWVFDKGIEWILYGLLLGWK
jgi:preprotein translocase subunit SecE